MVGESLPATISGLFPRSMITPKWFIRSAHRPGDERRDDDVWEKNMRPKKPKLTVAALTERLLAIAKKGEDSGGGPMLALARAALMDAARLNGLLRERGEEPKETLEDWLAEINRERGGQREA